MKQIKPTKEMVKAAKALGMGKILIVYKDHSNVRMETELNGPYVWRGGRWKLMRFYGFDVGSPYPQTWRP